MVFLCKVRHFQGHQTASPLSSCPFPLRLRLHSKGQEDYSLTSINSLWLVVHFSIIRGGTLLSYNLHTHIMNKENANELFDEIVKKSENVENFILYLQEHSIPFHKYKVYHDERRTESGRVEKNAIGFYTN